MPIHDWTPVSAGTIHAFHLSWISEIQLSLNGGLLPPDSYAQAEQIIGLYGPDAVTLQDLTSHSNGSIAGAPDSNGGIALAAAPPKARLTATTEMDDYVLKRRTLVIRHSSDDRIVALLEIVLPGNKSSRRALDSFVEKAVEALNRGNHLLIVDFFPPGRRDPQGLHGAIWSEILDEPFSLPADEPLTLAAHSAGTPKRAFVEPAAVGRDLLEMPLFLEPETYVNSPLESTYRGAFRGVPRKGQAVLESARQ